MPATNGASVDASSTSLTFPFRTARGSLGLGTLALLLVVGCGPKGDHIEKKGGDTTTVANAPARTEPASSTRDSSTRAGSDTIEMPPGARYGPLTAGMQGIGISRSQIDKGLGDTYSFVVGDSIEGREAAYAEYGDIHTLVIGPADNPLLASFFAPLLHQKENDEPAMAALRSYVKTVNPAASEWIESSVAAAMKSNTPTVETRSFGDQMIEFEFGLYKGFTTSGYVTVTVTHS